MNSPVRRIVQTPRATIKLLARQIDIKTSQPLRNIAERRCLLDALQKFGEVATFLPSKEGDKSNILAIYETSEAASKAVDASPLTISFPTSPIPPRADYGPAHEHPVNVNVTCDIHTSIGTQSEHEERIGGNPWNNDHMGYSYDKNHSAIKNDARIDDVIAAGAPRRVFADGVIDTSYLRGGQDIEQQQKKKKKAVELKGSLLALLDE
ncbi:conserved hypothetical protein [Talaromyces stipitatus ATCC 10500]|uniref:Uncharacterized protein n=1 Tax=Talaromyces stipitatus (strain ATCC 10500 / CBS 375.48 / QM 6759 / NRRL 1006) TaxID=441959 RepID=B8MGR5_TALSN|nr:uncharacterized protein TSTA_018820 [Talaromyces stipitatus ATCC 10500]EED16816.1 conserved hypothetical protein [Talaromyces stipitatus ATCC 10500]